MFNTCFLFMFWLRTYRDFMHLHFHWAEVTDWPPGGNLFCCLFSIFVSKCMILVSKQSHLEGNRHLTWGGWLGEATLKRSHPSGSHDGVGCGMNNGVVFRSPAVCRGRHFSFKGLGSYGGSCTKGWLERQEGLSVIGGVCLAQVPSRWAVSWVWEREGSNPTVQCPHLAVRF